MDSNLVASHIKPIIKAQFTLITAAIQAGVIEKWGYEISYKKALDGKHKALRHLFEDFSQSYTELPRLFFALEDENIDSWGWFLACFRNKVTQRMGIYVIFDKHPGIMTTMSDLGWAAPSTYRMICMRHLASYFMTRFKDKLLKNLVCKAALASTQRKFNKHMTTIGRINFEAQQWLEAIPFQLWALSHDGGRRYGILKTNMLEVFNSVLKGACSLPFTALVQLTFFCLNNYFVAIREQGANRLTSMSSSLHMLMLRFRVVLLRLDRWKLFFTITYKADFMSSQGVVECGVSTYMTKNAHVERH